MAIASSSCRMTRVSPPILTSFSALSGHAAEMVPILETSRNPLFRRTIRRPPAWTRTD